jgi:hypothetical protein
MFTLRCTPKLLKRLGLKGPLEAPPADTALGDWYANVFYLERRPLILATSEKSLLSVVLPARDLDGIQSHLMNAVRETLLRIGAPRPSVDRELHLMAEMAYGSTRSKSVLGSMNDFIATMKFTAHVRREWTLEDWADDCNETYFPQVPTTISGDGCEGLGW